MIPVDGEFILEVAPVFSGSKKDAQTTIVNAISGSFAAVLDSYQINTYLRIAHFMAQVTVECAGFRTTEEFASGNEYEGRTDLGNTHPGDGKRYKGRGLLQLTGRANYRSIGAILGLDLENHPEIAGDPLISLRIAGEYWKKHQINTPAEGDDLIQVTQLVNGGQNGIEDRRLFLGKAKAALKRRMGLVVAAAEGGLAPVLRRGSRGDIVGECQALLRKKGFAVAVDGDFGPASELAVIQLQRAAGLAPDGIVGAATWAALRA